MIAVGSSTSDDSMVRLQYALSRRRVLDLAPNVSGTWLAIGVLCVLVLPTVLPVTDLWTAAAGGANQVVVPEVSCACVHAHRVSQSANANFMHRTIAFCF